ncbi:MAG TPA: NAD(P)-binding domain-containing protein [Acidimicrobiia bacterium]|nr:NAD(P)-binding domain-containing protein [Acidimicrobiia bacterium]
MPASEEALTEVGTVVVGAGHAGLAVSHLLTARGIDHVVVDRDRVASNWRTARWDSFTLLTPNWATWLPGWHYTGEDPHGFMGRGDVVSYLEEYADSFSAPVRSGVDVTEMTKDNGLFRLVTSQGDMTANNVVVATGPFQVPRIPDWAAAVPPALVQIHSSEYRSPAALPDGPVLVIGAGPSGQQIAEDLIRAGRATFLSVGRHRRVPRRYRGRDYFWWREMGGSYEKTSEDVPLSAQRDGVSPALTGHGGGRDLDLLDLSSRGVGLLGRSIGVRGSQLVLQPDLAASIEEGNRAYREFTDWVEERLHRFHGLYGEPEPPPQFLEPPEPPETLDLHRVATVIWATGFRLDFSRWIGVPVLDEGGYPIHHRGVTHIEGLYFLGLPWLHRLRSPFIRGAGEDADHIVRHIVARAG